MKQVIDVLRKNPDFKLLYIAQFTSFLGSSMSMVAVPFQVFALSHSTFIVGLLSLLGLLPVLVTALIGGVFADRYPRRKMIIVSECLMAMGVLVWMLNAYFTTPSMVVIFMVAMFISGVFGFHRPAFDGITQQLLAKEDYKIAGVLANFKYSFGLIVGPMIAGILIGYVGIQFAYFIDFLSFVISLFCILKLKKLPDPIHEASTSVMTSLKQGLQFALGNQALLGSYLVDIVAMVAAVPSALFPAMAHALSGPKSLGLLFAAPAVGSLLVSIFSRWVQHVKADGKAIAIASGVYGFAVLCAGLNHTLWWVLLCLAVAGAADSISGIFRMNLWNHVIPYEMRGRLSGIEIISYLSGPKIGDFRAGICSRYMGFSGALISGGVVCVLAVIGLSFKLKAFWHYDERASNPQSE